MATTYIQPNYTLKAAMRGPDRGIVAARPEYGPKLEPWLSHCCHSRVRVGQRRFITRCSQVCGCTGFRALRGLARGLKTRSACWVTRSVDTEEYITKRRRGLLGRLSTSTTPTAVLRLLRFTLFNAVSVMITARREGSSFGKMPGRLP